MRRLIWEILFLEENRKKLEVVILKILIYFAYRCFNKIRKQKQQQKTVNDFQSETVFGIT